MAAAASTIVGFGTSSLSLASPRRTNINSGFVIKYGVRPKCKHDVPRQGLHVRFRDWLRRDLNVIGFGLIAWLAPSSVPAINGDSLTGLFFQSIGTELSHFPTGPALTSPFWLWMVCWHLGLFLCLTFGQIGFKGRSEDYF